MKLTDYLKTNSNADLARSLDCQAVLVSQWKTGFRPVPLERCTAIEKATNGAVSRRDLRPDDWHLIWPELAEPNKETA